MEVTQGSEPADCATFKNASKSKDFDLNIYQIVTFKLVGKSKDVFIISKTLKMYRVVKEDVMKNLLIC